METFENLSAQFGEQLLQKTLKIAAAESCTGGLFCEVLTRIPGSSNWFDRGFITYSNEAKIEMLGVKLSTLEQFGAVSEQTVIEMTQGVFKHSNADIACAITGIAGPDGGTKDKPVGLVWMGFAKRNDTIQTHHEIFKGDRQSIRKQVVKLMLKFLKEIA